MEVGGFSLGDVVFYYQFGTVVKVFLEMVDDIVIKIVNDLDKAVVYFSNVVFVVLNSNFDTEVDIHVFDWNFDYDFDST